MNRRLSFPLMAISCVLIVIAFSDDLPGQERKATPLTVRTQLRPVAWKAGRTLWFGPGPCWVDGWEGGVQSCTLDETVELEIWNTTRREMFAPGFIRFERAAGGVKEGVLASDLEQCVVNTASNSKKKLMFVGKTATVEFGYDGCVMKGTLVKEETLRKWDLTSETYPAGTVVEFNGAGDVIRGARGPGAAGPPTILDGDYTGTCNLDCFDNPPGPPAPPERHSWWPDSGLSSTVIPFSFKAKGGVLQGGNDTSVYSLKWQGSYDTSGAITKGMMTGWVDLGHLSYCLLSRPDAWRFPRGAPEDERYSKLRWTITGPITGTLGPPATGSLAINTPNDVVNDERPERTDRLRIPVSPNPAGGIITCGCTWTAAKGRSLDLTPTPEGTPLDLKTGTKGSLDLIFVIDQTSSMSDDIEQVKKTAKDILASIASAFPSYRVAIVGYRDWSDTEMFKDIPFSSNASEIQAAIDSLTVSGGGDEPEAVLEALLRAIRLPWRNGSNKQIILMGDAPPHSPIPQGPDKDKTADDVVKAAFEVDPAVINTILVARSPGSFSEDAKKAFEDLSARSKGTSVTADKAEEVPRKMMDVMDVIRRATPEVPTAGGGGGAPVLPASGADTPVIVAILLFAACVCLVVAIVIVRQRTASVAAPGRTGAGLKVQAGLTVVFADGRSRSFRITGARTTIGRGADNLLVVDDDEASASHAEIVVSREGFLLRDVGSSNGTTVNGQRVTETFLSVGDEIGIGTTRVTLTD